MRSEVFVFSSTVRISYTQLHKIGKCFLLKQKYTLSIIKLVELTENLTMFILLLSGKWLGLLLDFVGRQ